jgi:LacI family transcriptional regulator
MPKPKRLSQTAIAKTLGVSRATVSLILRGGEGASEVTKTKVLAAAKKLGYRPNALVQSIRSGKSRTIGVLAQPHDSYWRDVCYGIHDRLIESEHLPCFLWNNDRLGVESADYCLKQIHRLLDHWVDGVVLWPFFAELYDVHLKEFQTRNIPLVAIDHPLPHASADVVESDESQMAGLIVDHLTKLKHRQVLVVSGPKDDAWADNRFRAMKERFGKVAGTVVHELRALLGPEVEPVNAEAIGAFLRAHPTITAVVAGTDLIARSAYLAANALGWAIPQRLSVASVADLDFAVLLSPPLTTVRQDGYAIGRRAAQYVLERSAGLLTGPPKRFRQPGIFMARKSTGPAPDLSK